MLCCYVQYAIEMQTATHHTQKLTSDGKANAFDGGISAIQVQDKGTVMACYVLTFYGQILHVYSTEIPDEENKKNIKLIIHERLQDHAGTNTTSSRTKVWVWLVAGARPVA